MSNRLVGLVVAGALVVVGAGAVALASGDGAAAFKVGSREISQASVDDELAVLHDNPVVASSIIGQQVGPFDEGSIPQSVTAGWLQVRLIAEFAAGELARRGEKVTRADRAAVGLPNDATFKALPRDFRDTLVESVARVRALQRVVSDDPAVDRTLAQSCPSGRWISHILVATQQEAETIKQRLAEGGDFADLARTSSTDTGSASQGGSLGCLTGPDQFVEPFVSVAASQPIGVVSDPVQTEFGFHLILASDTAGPGDRDAATLARVLDSARAAKVELDPRYGVWDAQNGQVVPSAVPKP